MDCYLSEIKANLDIVRKKNQELDSNIKDAIQIENIKQHLGHINKMYSHLNGIHDRFFFK